ncbi:MAG: hypothetical protein IJW58_02185 [Clostridia bacterium]|nr:hypothetical protein [Clostridia bacterium]
MNKFLKRIVSVGSAVCMVVSLATGCDFNFNFGGDEENKEYISSTWTDMPENTNENLKYFAYFHSDGFNGGEEYFSDIASLNNANVVMINSAFEVAVGVERLKEARSYGMQAFVTLHGLFSNQQVGRVGAAILNQNWLSIWRNILKNYEEFIEDGTILGFYFDEPYWNGIKEEDFLLVTHTIRKECPSVKLMACLTAVEIGARAGNVPEVSPEYHRYCTDLMYDSYVGWNDEQRRDYTEKLKAKAINNQYIWGCPKGFVDSYEEEGNEEMIKHIKGFYTEAIQDERFAGIVSFSYAGGLDGGDWGYGLNTFFDVDSENAYFDEELRNVYLQIGREITGKAESAKTAPVVEINAETEIRSLGEITIPNATVTDAETTSKLTPKITVYAPDGKIIESENGKFTANYGGRYSIAYTVTDSDYNTTKVKHGVWVRGVGELSAFEDELYSADVVCEEGWKGTLDYNRTYAGSRGSLKVSAVGDSDLSLSFTNAVNLSTDFTDICGMIYNPTSTAMENLAIFVTDGVNVVESVSSLNPKKWTEIAISRAYILSVCPDFDFSNVTVGVKQLGDNKVETFYLDAVKVR